MPRRHHDLWPRLISFENLLAAAHNSARGKRFRQPVLKFQVELEHELYRLQAALRDHSYRPGDYCTFFIHHPKKRLISAAPYRDRVVHHALVNVLEPIYEGCFIHDSYACRKGKGTHAAMRRAQHYARRHRWAWKADIAKFFPSIDHSILKQLLARKIGDPDVLWLAGLLIDRSNPQEEVYELFPGDDLFAPSERRRGLPLGNQTSQFFANVYLDPLDHFLKDHLRVPGYVRYVDYFIAFAGSKQELQQVREAARECLAALRLKLHAKKDAIFPVKQGMPFLGYRVWASHVKLAAENVYRFRRRLRNLQDRYARREIDWPEAAMRISSWVGHASQADTLLLRERLLAEHPFRRASAE